MPSLTSQSCGDSLPAVCLAGKSEPFTDHPAPMDAGQAVNEASVKVDR